MQKIYISLKNEYDKTPKKDFSRVLQKKDLKKIYL